MAVMTSATDVEQMPPADIGAEKCVLGGILFAGLNPKDYSPEQAIGDVMAVMSPADHWRPAHRLLHEAIIGLHGRGEPVHPVAVAAELARRGDLVVSGGAVYLHDLIAMAPTAANAGYYARIVREKAILRSTIEVSDRIKQMALGADGDAVQIAERARAELDAIIEMATVRTSKAMPDVVATVLKRIEEGSERGIPTPWADLNDVVPGLAPGEFIVVGGRPGEGKSIIGVQMAWHAAKSGIPTLMASMEMTAEDQAMRLISGDAQVDLTALLRAHVEHDADWLRIGNAAADLADSMLEIEDTPLQTVGQIRARMRKMAGGRKCGLLVVDYLGLVQAKAESRQQAVAQVSRDLKLLARAENVPVVALAQLNRDSAKGSRRPMQSDLRDSGQIEADADMVFLLYQPPDDPGVLEIIVEKQRQGPKTTVELTFQGHYARAVNRAWSPSDSAGI